jgi:hypothetical protein
MAAAKRGLRTGGHSRARSSRPSVIRRSTPGWNIGGVLFGRSGYLIAIPIGWVPQAVMTGGLTAAVNLSMVLDYSGNMSCADQLVFLGNVIPILDLALGAFEEFKYGWWEAGKRDYCRAWLVIVVRANAPGKIRPPVLHRCGAG